MNRIYTRTDLASECTAGLDLEKSNVKSKDYSFESATKSGFDVSVLKILNSSGERVIGKPCGTYVTVNTGKIWHATEERFSAGSEIICEYIKKLFSECSGDTEARNILVAGLGNRYITSDAIGHEALKNVIITRHLEGLNTTLYNMLGGKSVSGIAPGVIGQTGIETLELIRGAAKNVKPDLVIVIDALVARELSNLATTVQITDTGIAPGSGIGNTRHAINRHSIGCPVIAIGVPTVVESSTLVYDALEKAGIDSISPSLKAVLENGRGFFVTPKETDTVTVEVSRLIADAINLLVS